MASRTQTVDNRATRHRIGKTPPSSSAAATAATAAATCRCHDKSDNQTKQSAKPKHCFARLPWQRLGQKQQTGAVGTRWVVPRGGIFFFGNKARWPGQITHVPREYQNRPKRTAAADISPPINLPKSNPRRLISYAWGTSSDCCSLPNSGIDILSTNCRSRRHERVGATGAVGKDSSRDVRECV